MAPRGLINLGLQIRPNKSTRDKSSQPEQGVFERGRPPSDTRLVYCQVDVNQNVVLT